MIFQHIADYEKNDLKKYLYYICIQTNLDPYDFRT